MAGEGPWTFLFTDIEGSTVLWEREPEPMKLALERHDALLRGCFAEHGGVVFGTRGDGLAVVFDDGAAAMAASLDAQRRLAGEAWPNGLAVRVRMGLHRGPAAPRDGDFFGPHVNLAARVMSAAGGGQVLASDAARRAGEGGAAFEGLGRYRLRGIEAPVELFGVHEPGVPWDGRPINASPQRRTNLPPEVPALLGRHEELGRIATELGAHRLVTLCGAGGIGKTALATVAAARELSRRPDGVWFVDLAALDHPIPNGGVADVVLDLVAAALRVPPGPHRRAAAALTDWLSGRELLIVLDTCEHLTAAARGAVTVLLEAGPGVRVLTTSRARLRHRHEQVVEIGPLGAGAARALLCERAAALDATPTTEAELAAVEALCARLDGLPLAIELAAAQLRWLTPADLLGRLDQAGGALGDGADGADGAEAAATVRHSSLQATMNWSYRLLGPTERSVLRRLSAFAGGFDLAAAETVGAGGRVETAAVPAALGVLVEQSLVSTRRTASGMRYRLLDPVRRAAARRLEAAGERGQVARRHAEHYARAAEAADELVHGPRQAEGDATFDADWDNIRAAHRWAVAEDRAELAGRLLAAVEQHAYYRVRHELGEWARRSIEACSAPPIVADAIASRWAVLAGDSAAALAHGEAGVARWAARCGSRPIDDGTAGPQARLDAQGAAGCWAMLAHCHAMGGRAEAAVHAAEQTERIVALLDDERSRQLARFARSFSGLLDDWPSVRSARRALIEAQERFGSPRMRANAAVQRAMLARMEEPPDLAGALALCRTGAELARPAGSVFDEAQSLIMAAALATTLATPDSAEDCIEALSFVRRTGYGVFLGSAFGAAVRALAAAGALPACALVFGHTAAHHPLDAAGIFGGQAPDEVPPALAADPGARAAIARGAAMERRAVLDLAIDALHASRVGPAAGRADARDR